MASSARQSAAVAYGGIGHVCAADLDAVVSEKRSRLSIVAESVAFPVVALAGGTAHPPQIGGWGGEDDAPFQVTLRYGSRFVDQEAYVTTHPVEAWMAPEELARATLTSFLAAIAARGTHGEYIPHDDSEAAHSRARAEAMQAASHERMLTLDDRAVSVCVVGRADLWAAAFSESDTDVPHRTVVLDGRNVPLEQVALQVAADLPSLLSSAQR